jgi:hypoxanthine phosphoribosyltransferase
LFSKEQIHEAIKVIATEIEKDYADSSPLFLVVMKGAIFFAADLIRLVNLQSQIEVISAKSYGAQMESSGNVELKSFGENFKGKDIIILEDIVDSGLTLKSLTDYVHTFNPKSVAVAALLSATYGKRSSLSGLNAIFLGMKAKSWIYDAAEIDKHSTKINLVAATHLMHLPSFYGGDKKKARKLLLDAFEFQKKQQPNGLVKILLSILRPMSWILLPNRFLGL